MSILSKESDRYNQVRQKESARSHPPGATGFTEDFPGLIVIMLDQSGSMDERWGDLSQRKSQLAADALNEICKELTYRNRRGTSWKKRVHLTVFGYSTLSLDPNAPPNFINLCSGWPENFGPRWLDYGDIDKNTEFNRPIEEAAYCNTPMAEAFAKAGHIIKELFETDPKLRNGFPPVVINICDGAPDDRKVIDGKLTGDGEGTKQAADALKSIYTDWGELVLINLLIDPNHVSEAVFVHDRNSLPDKDHEKMRFFFDLSSPLPDYLRDRARSLHIPTQSGARGFSVTASPKKLVEMLKWGSFDASQT